MKPFGDNHPHCSKRLLARILAALKKNGDTTDQQLAKELGTPLGHIYDARNQEPRITCSMWSSANFGKNGELGPGGYVLRLATRKELRLQAALYRSNIRDDQKRLRDIQRALRKTKR